MQQSARRGRNLLEADRHSLEFTSGQLIIAICGLLLLWLAGFLMGVVAGRVEFGSKVAEVSESNAPDAAPVAPAPEKDKAESTAKRAPAPAKQPPAKETKTAATRKAAPAPAPKASTTAKAPAAASKSPAPKFLGDVPSAAATSTQPAAAPPAPAPQNVAVAAVPVAPAETPAPAPPAAEPPRAEATTPAPAADPKPADEPKPETAKNEKGNFTIQIISYKASNKKLADDYLKRLKESAGLDVSLTQSKDGKVYQIVFGSFPDRASAEKAQAELKKKPEFADCIVRER